MMNLFNLDRKFYISLSDAIGFHKDVIEKVHRLIMILEFINGNLFLRERLVLILKSRSIILYGIIYCLSSAGKSAPNRLEKQVRLEL